MIYSDFRQLFVILLKLWENFRDKPAAESGLLQLPISFARKKTRWVQSLVPTFCKLSPPWIVFDWKILC